MSANQKNTIQLGGTVSCGRLYLQDLEFIMPSGTRVVVQKTHKDDLGDLGMADLIARHKGRYSLVGLFCRPGYKVLDFPCGSGYAVDLLKEFSVIYEGMDLDSTTLEYASHVYGMPTVEFVLGDLCNPRLGKEKYDVVACIEGLEHIGGEFQSQLIRELKKALKTGGTMIVSSPENPKGISGPSTKNRWHKWELTRADFLSLLYSHFKRQEVELVTHKATLHTGERTTCFYGICHKS